MRMEADEPRDLPSARPIWITPYRPFFLLAAIWAIIAPSVWLWPGGFGDRPGFWHAHELIFGTGAAAMAGYLLTSLPAWTGQRSCGPAASMTLVAIWALGRACLLAGDRLPIALVTGAAAAFPVALAVVLARALAAPEARAGKPHFVAAAVALAALDGLSLAGMRGGGYDAAALLAVLVFALLIGTIGGRAVPAFTRNYLSATGAAVSERRRTGRLAQLCIAGALLLQLAGGREHAGYPLIAAGILHLWRMRGWQSLRARSDAALAMLHAAWIWLPSGLILIGLAKAVPQAGLAESDALHGLTMGAMGAMIVAISGRAVMPRRDGRLEAGRTLGFAFALIWLAALVRVAGAAAVPLPVSAALWIAGWALYLTAFLPALRAPLVRPVFSGQRRD